MDAGAGGLAAGVEPGQAGLAVEARADAARQVVGGGHDRLWFRIWRTAGKAKPFLEQHIVEDPQLKVVTDRLPHYQQVETYTTLVEWMKDHTRFECETALQEALRLRPDAVCLDLEMPRMDGFTFLRLLMARQPTPVIIVTGKGSKADVFRALELGAADFVVKPVSHASTKLEKIADRIGTHVEGP